MGAMQWLVLHARAHPLLALVAVTAVTVLGWSLIIRLAPGDARRIRRTIGEVTDGLVRADAERVLDQVSPRFLEPPWDKEALERTLPRILRENPVDSVSVTIRELEVVGGTARARVRASSVSRQRTQRVRATTEWVVRFEKVDDRWMLTKARPLSVNEVRLGSLDALLSSPR